MEKQRETQSLIEQMFSEGREGCCKFSIFATLIFVVFLNEK
jgi:hypothetical protein